MTRSAKVILFLMAGLVIALYVGSIQAVLTPDRGTVTYTQLPTIEVETGDPSLTDCYEEGNLICGDKDHVLEEQAWATWDSIGGWKYLRVDPSRSFKVEYVGTAKVYPELGEGMVALPSTDGGYWVFRAQYTTPLTPPTV